MTVTPLKPWDPAFNEYERIVPRGSDHYSHVVSSAFKDAGDDLVFCLMEHVTISNLVGIGSTHVYHHHYDTPEQLHRILDEYDEIIQEMKAHPTKGLSSKPDWYKREGGCLLSGETGASTSRLGSGQWLYRPRKPRPDGVKYIADDDETPLEESHLKSYLGDYLDKLILKPWFGSAPYHCTIVRPISLRDKSIVDQQTYIPLGNFYLHFGMLRPKSLEFFQDLVNKLLWVWFRNHGYGIAKELQNVPAEGDRPSKPYEPQLDADSRHRLTSVPNANVKNHTWQKFFDAAFKDLDSNGTPKVAARLIHFDNQMFVGVTTTSQLKKAVTDYLETIRTKRKTLKSFEHPGAAHTIEAFVHLLNTRRCALILLTVCNMPPSEVHPLVMMRGKSAHLDDTNLSYFPQNLLIPSQSLEVEADAPVRAYQTVSPDEVKLLRPLRDLVGWNAPIAASKKGTKA